MKISPVFGLWLALSVVAVPVTCLAQQNPPAEKKAASAKAMERGIRSSQKKMGNWNTPECITWGYPQQQHPPTAT